MHLLSCATCPPIAERLFRVDAGFSRLTSWTGDEPCLPIMAVAATRQSLPFEICAFVVLPDHLHAVWQLPPPDHDFSTRWRLIKSRFAKALPKDEPRSIVQIKRNERGIWQHRFWEHLIRDEADYARHVEYCWVNPLKHGLVTRVRDWPHSSFHRDVRAGLVPIDWAGEPDASGDFGEKQ
jgi:REP-associated tyrosine transposase